jgi:hypothetical protein
MLTKKISWLFYCIYCTTTPHTTSNATKHRLSRRLFGVWIRVAAGATWFTVHVAVPPRVVIISRSHTPLLYGSFHPEAQSNECEHCYSGEVCRVDRPLHPKLTATCAVWVGLCHKLSYYMCRINVFNFLDNSVSRSSLKPNISDFYCFCI